MGNLLVLEPWNEVGDWQFRSVDIWAQILGLPEEYYTVAVGKSLASYLGDPKQVMVIRGFQQGDRVTYLRCRITLDITVPLRQQVCVRRRSGKEEFYSVRYERLPIFCYKCGVIGHEAVWCDLPGPSSSPTPPFSAALKGVVPTMRLLEAAVLLYPPPSLAAVSLPPVTATMDPRPTVTNGTHTSALGAANLHSDQCVTVTPPSVNPPSVTPPCVSFTPSCAAINPLCVTDTPPWATINPPCVTATPSCAAINSLCVTDAPPWATINPPSVPVTPPCVAFTTPCVTVTPPSISINPPCLTVTSPSMLPVLPLPRSHSSLLASLSPNSGILVDSGLHLQLAQLQDRLHHRPDLTPTLLALLPLLERVSLTSGETVTSILGASSGGVLTSTVPSTRALTLTPGPVSMSGELGKSKLKRARRSVSPLTVSMDSDSDAHFLAVNPVVAGAKPHGGP